MKKIKKIGGLVAIFLFNFYNTCFADVVLSDEQAKYHGRPVLLDPPTKKIDYVLIGLLVLIVVICAVIIIRRIIKKKKEKENDNK